MDTLAKNEVLNKIQLAHQAKSLWKSFGVQKRVELLRPLIPAFKALQKDITLLTVKEMGKTITEANADHDFEFEYLEAFLNHGPEYIQDEIVYKNGQAVHKIIYEPRGVVASIAPWNFPFSNFIWAVIPNLIVGNTVVFKHSEYCPGIGKLCEDVMNNLADLPQGVFSEVYGDGHVGEFLVNQAIDLIWFTGSSHTGKKLFEIAGKKHIKAILEMGGSSPAVVFEDADIPTTVQAVFNRRFLNCGQVCDGTKLLIIHEDIYEKFVSQLSAIVEKMTVGDPLSPATQLGPLASEKQLILLESQVQDAIKNGSKIITGGTRPQNKNISGNYFLPTLLTNIKPDMRVWKEEVFGPVLPIITFRDEAEAVKLANDTPYGLSANIYTKNMSRAQKIARELDAGSININEGDRWQSAATPFGGIKASGMGCEHGRHGFQELCQIKVIAEG